MGKGEIARYEQFLLFPRCFLKACFPGASKGVVWEWVKEDLPRNIPATFRPNWPSGLGGDVKRNCQQGRTDDGYWSTLCSGELTKNGHFFEKCDFDN